MKIKLFLLETRPQFLILSLVISFLGISIAWHDGYLHWGHAILSAFGLLLAHTSVNVLNDYFDFRSGIDLATERTPFSGGSGMLPAGILKTKEVLWLGVGCFIAAMFIGIYFIIVTGWQLLPLLLVGGLCILLYTSFILKTKWPEWSPGAGLGILPVIGTYFVQTGFYSWPMAVAAVPSAILVHNLLFLNEFPDTEADLKASRKTTPIVLGKNRASFIYAATDVFMYVWIIGSAVAGVMPLFTLLALLTAPLAIQAIRGAYNYSDKACLVNGMKNNVMVVLATQFLLGLGFILARLFNG
ncbi:prenyltransferase [Chloroflexota bacterium]